MPFLCTKPGTGSNGRFRLAWGVIVLFAVFANPKSDADQPLLRVHCGKCHSGAEPEGDFDVSSLGTVPSRDSVELWTASLDYVKAGEMPPVEKNRLSESDRNRIVKFLNAGVVGFQSQRDPAFSQPRRLNNRELANSIADVLLLKDTGTHQPMANLLGDTLKDGFDTNADALGLSKFHLEQYITAFSQDCRRNNPDWYAAPYKTLSGNA